jgi:hypothetical protein
MRHASYIIQNDACFWDEWIENYNKSIYKKKISELFFLADCKIMRTLFNIWSKHSGATDIFVRVGDSNIICNYKMHKSVASGCVKRCAIILDDNYILYVQLCSVGNPLLNDTFNHLSTWFSQNTEDLCKWKKWNLKCSVLRTGFEDYFIQSYRSQFDLPEFLCEL